MKDKSPDNFFKTNKTLLKFAGMWFPKKEKSYKEWIFRALQISFYILNCHFWFCLTEIYAIRETYMHKSLFIEHLGRVIIHILTNIKVFNFFWNKEQIFYVMETLENEEFRYKSINDFKPALHFQETKTFASRLGWFSFFVSTIVPVSYFFSPFIQFVSSYSSTEPFRGNVTCSTILPYHSLPPFPTQTMISCGFGIGYQFISILLYSWQVAAHDGLFSTILMYIKTHLVVVGGAFESVKPRCDIELKLLETNKQENSDAKNLMLIQQMDKEMIRCTKHLESIIMICDATESIFNFVALGQALNTLFTLVSCLFLLSNVSILSTTFLAQALYILGLFYQLCLYCWFGNEVTLTGLTITDCLYRSDWVSASPTYKRVMLMNMIHMDRPIEFTAGKFTTLTLATLSAIVRGSYSYFAVLKNTEA